MSFEMIVSSTGNTPKISEPKVSGLFFDNLSVGKRAKFRNAVAVLQSADP
jgi:hypothetical protein